MCNENKKEKALDRTVSGNTSKTSSDEDISMIELFRLIIGSWKLVGGIASVVSAAAITYALMATEIYQAKILLVPVKEEKTSMAGLSHLLESTVMTGLSMPASHKEQVLATLESRKFLSWYIEKKNLLPILFEGQWDEKKEEWKIEPNGKIPSNELAYRVFSGSIELSEDRKTGLISLSVFWKDPQLATQWANELIKYLNEELRKNAIENSKKRIGYLKQELTKTTVKDMKEVLYGLIESEERKAMLANVNEEFALQVIDPAVVPDERARPDRRLIAILGGLLGLLLGFFAVFLRQFIKTLPQSQSTEAKL